jgi:hypothetical protein
VDGAAQITSTSSTSTIGCWDASLAAPGSVEIATSGQWNGITIGLKGNVDDGNHAKIGVSTDAASDLAIFGDMNQEGDVGGTDCGRKQNGRGGLFFVVHDHELAQSVAELLRGASAPLQ